MHHRPRLLLLVAAVVVLVVALGLTAGSTLQARRQRTHTQQALHHAQTRLRQMQASLGDAQTNLRAAQRRRVGLNIQQAQLAAQLGQAQAQLAAYRATAHDQVAHIASLNQCLTGVEAALNEVALHNPTGALRSLNAVAGPCAVVGADHA